MDTCREIFLRTTLYDTELIQNRENDKEVLPSMSTLLQKLHRAQSLLIQKHEIRGSSTSKWNDLNSDALKVPTFDNIKDEE